MTTQSPDIGKLLDRAKIQDALSYGERYCEEEGLPVTDTEIVWQLLCEAATTERALPDREKQWLMTADRSGMPDCQHTKAELIEQWATMVARVAAGMESKEVLAVRGPAPSAAAIDRMMVVMPWLRYVPAGRKHGQKQRNQRVLWAMAGGRSGGEVGRAVGLDRRSVSGIKTMCVRVIANKVYDLAENLTPDVDTSVKIRQPSVHVQ